MQTFDDLYAQVLQILPLATMGEDNDGQLIIYTGLGENQDGTLYVMPDEVSPGTSYPRHNIKWPNKYAPWDGIPKIEE